VLLLSSDVSNASRLTGAIAAKPRGPWGRKKKMTWTTPTLVEICIGLEINGYLPAEFLMRRIPALAWAA
jgi:coenzyme PQQ precursor peptide PqqA